MRKLYHGGGILLIKPSQYYTYTYIIFYRISESPKVGREEDKEERAVFIINIVMAYLYTHDGFLSLYYIYISLRRHILEHHYYYRRIRADDGDAMTTNRKKIVGIAR